MTTTDGKCPLAFPPPRVHYRTMGISRKGGGNRVDGRAFNPLSSCLAVRKCSHQRENRRDTGKRGRRKKKEKRSFSLLRISPTTVRFDREMIGLPLDSIGTKRLATAPRGTEFAVYGSVTEGSRA